jgi:ABC-2 type transport system ATP-binding protein
MEMEFAIRLEELQKTYSPGLGRRRTSALRGLSLRVRPGEVYALIGPNGAGKTTTFRILLGLLRPDAGEGSILGFPLGHPEALRRLGFLPESPCFYPYLRVREFLCFAGRLSGVAEPGAAADRVLQEFGLEALRDRPLRRLSKGQVQRVGIAQAALHEPALLILDEPMSGLDPMGRAEVKEWIRALRAGGRTVVLASHVLADVEALADRVGLLREGALIAEGATEDLLGAGGTEVEIEFEFNGDPKVLLDGLDASLERRVGLWAALLAGGREMEVSALLARILSHGGSVRSVERRRASLEGFYLASFDAVPERAAGARGAP